jgi:hypothetical protein
MNPSLQYKLVQRVVHRFDVGLVQYTASSQRTFQLSDQLATPRHSLLTMLKLVDRVRMRHSETVSRGAKNDLCGLRVDIGLMWESHWNALVPL